jgi:hypothetical protein
MMDLERRRRLVEKIKSTSWKPSRNPGPTVTLEEFFEGNDDSGSIGCNLVPTPSPADFYRILSEIRSRNDVQDVLVEIRDMEDTEGIWPFSDTVFVLTSATPEDLKKWLKPLSPDEVGHFPAEHIPKDLPPANPGINVFGAWWD